MAREGEAGELLRQGLYPSDCATDGDLCGLGNTYTYRGGALRLSDLYFLWPAEKREICSASLLMAAPRLYCGLRGEYMLTISELRGAHKALHPELGGTISEFFALRWLETEHKLSRERAMHQVAFGESQAFGVHGFHLDETRGALLLLVCSPSKHVSDFSESLAKLSQDGISLLFATKSYDDSDPVALAESLNKPRRGLNRFEHQFQVVLTESNPVIKTVNFRLIFFGNADAAANSVLVKNFEEDVLHRRQSIEKRLSRPDMEMSCTVKSADGSSSIPDRLKGFRTTISVANHVKIPGPDGRLMHVGSVSLMELLDMYRRLGIRFLSRNVRASLKLSTGSNQALSTAFNEVARGTSPPELFLFRHNGVTLTAQACTPNDSALALVEPQLLNGAQTVTTLARVCQQLIDKGEYTKAVEGRLARLSVIGRVITNGDRDFVTSVSIASNRQNPIMPWHLRAHDDVQSSLQAWFLDHLGLYYQVQEGAFESMTVEERDWHGILESEKCLEIRKLAQTFMATEGMVDKMQQLKTVFEDDAIYARVFCTGRMNAVPEDVVFCFKIERRIGKMLNMLGGTDKYAFVKGARSLIWALLCQSYLNDSRRETLAEAHGRHLVATQDFTDAVERFASTRVKPLLMWIANESDYVEDVKAEKYGFLSSRRIFDLTVHIGRQKWGWLHRRLGNCP